MTNVEIRDVELSVIADGINPAHDLMEIERDWTDEQYAYLDSLLNILQEE